MSILTRKAILSKHDNSFCHAFLVFSSEVTTQQRAKVALVSELVAFSHRNAGEVFPNYLM